MKNTDKFNLTKDYRRKFAEEIEQKYFELDKNLDFCKKFEFDRDYQNLPFNELQIGKLLQYDKIFDTEEKIRKGIRTDNTLLAESFAESMHLGEQKHIIDTIIKNINTNKKVIQLSFEELSTLIKSHLFTDVFIPNQFLEVVYSWIKYSAIEFQEHTFLIIDGKKIKIHWLKDEDLKDCILFLNKDKVNLIRKNIDQMKKIKSLSGFESHGKKHLDIKVGRVKNNNKNFALLLRTVNSILFDKEHITIFNIKK